MPVRNTRMSLYVAVILAVGAIIYFINGLTQPVTKIPIVLGPEEALSSDDSVSIVFTQGTYYPEMIFGIERIASDHTAPALAVLLIAAAIACTPQIRRAINLEVPKTRGHLTAIFVMLAGFVPQNLAFFLNTWILERQGVELGERSVTQVGILELTEPFFFVGIGMVFYVSKRVKEAKFHAQSQEDVAFAR